MASPKTRAEVFDCSVAGRRVDTMVAVYEFPFLKGGKAEARRPVACTGFSICGLFKTSALHHKGGATGCPLLDLGKKDPIW